MVLTSICIYKLAHSSEFSNSASLTKKLSSCLINVFIANLLRSAAMIEKSYSSMLMERVLGIGVAVIAIVSISDRISLNFSFCALKTMFHQ